MEEWVPANEVEESLLEGEGESTEDAAMWFVPWKEFLNRVEGQQWVPVKELQEGVGGKLGDEREWAVATEFTDFRSEDGRFPPTAGVKKGRRIGEETGAKLYTDEEEVAPLRDMKELVTAPPALEELLGTVEGIETTQKKSQTEENSTFNDDDLDRLMTKATATKDGRKTNAEEVTDWEEVTAKDGEVGTVTAPLANIELTATTISSLKEATTGMEQGITTTKDPNVGSFDRNLDDLDFVSVITEAAFV